MRSNESRKEHDNYKIGIQRLLNPKDVAEFLGINAKIFQDRIVRGRA
jgi:hypothetical protein